MLRFCFTNTDQIIFPYNKITKKALLDYYSLVGPLMIRYLANKPTVLHRFVQGIDHQGTFDASIPNSPDWISHKKIGLKLNPYINYIILNSVEQLLYAINNYCITPHIFLHNSNNLYYPDFMIFVLEKKPNAKFNLLRWAAEKLKNTLELYKIKPFGMIGPQNKIIILVPLQAKDSFKQVRICAFSISKKIAAEYPQYLTVNPNETVRENQIFINTEYNRISAVIPSPYSVLPERQAPITLPFFWEEIHRLKPNQHSMLTVEKRLETVGDPWKEIENHQQSLFNFAW